MSADGYLPDGLDEEMLDAAFGGCEEPDCPVCGAPCDIEHRPLEVALANAVRSMPNNTLRAIMYVALGGIALQRRVIDELGADTFLIEDNCLTPPLDAGVLSDLVRMVREYRRTAEANGLLRGVLRLLVKDVEAFTEDNAEVINRGETWCPTGTTAYLAAKGLAENDRYDPFAQEVTA